MKTKERLYEVMAELLAAVHQMRVQFNDNMEGLSKDVNDLRKDVAVLQSHQAKTNLELSEIRLSLMKLADESEKYKQHDERISRLELEVFKKAS
ncbi:MAG: hypothetical protein SFW35_00840 [Chitinophagales bacterium]|nr:hypothetical protein [Chitinophagales bacterium]